MLIVKVKDDKSIESALKTFKAKINKTKVIQELKDRSEFVKPSVKKRKIKLKAQYIQKLRNQDDQG